ncbi:interferon alpha-inducible protein 27, mitochondrial-like [Cephus cinctus]|uniref:Interferon alpha-inducible protein 27, mitochondrial-like n=1 Tax=Cephus cinctus TaxID=211228 RepID=A0AAJ7RM89_CEPCN|nr:interferon alpha-inducible protein 27, mitochondrial-like [Cephus cinctus]
MKRLSTPLDKKQELLNVKADVYFFKQNVESLFLNHQRNADFGSEIFLRTLGGYNHGEATIIVSSGFSITISSGALTAALPAIAGFGATGIASESLAASWQYSIGLVAAGSLFATLQSLGATGLATLLFGAVGTVASGTGALFLLCTIASRLNWFKCKNLVDAVVEEDEKEII